MSTDDIVGSADTGEAIAQLCGELWLQPVPARPPAVARANAVVGLELLDLLLNPDHILRVTEELTLRNTLTLERRVGLDVSLDGLSRQQEEGATQLSALVNGRVGLHGADQTDPELLWLPLDTVSRPVSVGVTVAGADEMALPRPPQRAVRQALAAALAQILQESLRAHPEFVNTTRERGSGGDQTREQIARERNVAVWLLERSVLSVCDLASTSHRSERRLETPAAVLTSPSPDGTTPLRHLIDHAPSAAHRRALSIVQDVLLRDDPFLDLLRLVHGQYFVVAGLDRSTRHHLVHYGLPDTEAAGESGVHKLGRRALAGLDPRQHNFSFHVRVPIPDNVREFNLYVRAAAEGGVAAPYDVSVVGAIGFDHHPARSALDALATCAVELETSVLASEVVGTNLEHENSDVDDVVVADRAKWKLRYLLSRAVPALDRLDAAVAEQQRAADELAARAGRASPRKVRKLLAPLRGVVDEAQARLSHVRARLTDLGTGDADVAGKHEGTTEAVRAAGEAVEHSMLARRLVSSALTGQQIGRLSLRRWTLAPSSGPRARWLDIWATVSDESRPYAYGAIVPPLGLALLLYLAGALLLDAPTWPVHVPDLSRETIAGRQADAIVGVLLLIPGFALTQFHRPDPASVSARLHRPGYLFVQVTIVTLGVTSVVVATQVGVGDAAPTHPDIVLLAFRAALCAFTVWSIWALLASALRRSHFWRPKGLGWLNDSRGHTGLLRGALLRLVRYRDKLPDAEFDMTKPGRSEPS